MDETITFASTFELMWVLHFVTFKYMLILSLHIMKIVCELSIINNVICFSFNWNIPTIGKDNICGTTTMKSKHC